MLAGKELNLLDERLRIRPRRALQRLGQHVSRRIMLALRLEYDRARKGGAKARRIQALGPPYALLGFINLEL